MGGHVLHHLFGGVVCQTVKTRLTFIKTHQILHCMGDVGDCIQPVHKCIYFAGVQPHDVHLHGDAHVDACTPKLGRCVGAEEHSPKSSVHNKQNLTVMADT